MAAGKQLVHRSLYEAYVRKLAEKAEHLPVGDPAAGQVALGPIIDAPQCDRIHAIVSAAVKSGARLVAGGTYDGLFYKPTVLPDVPLDSMAFRDEIFGPVASVIPFDTVEQAIELARDTEYGLSLGIVTRDVMKGLAIAEQIPSGCVHINDQTVVDDIVNPFGGVKASGSGSRVGGAQGIHGHSMGHLTQRAPAVSVLSGALHRTEPDVAELSHTPFVSLANGDLRTLPDLDFRLHSSPSGRARLIIS